MTIRREIEELLGRGEFTARQISVEIHISERDVAGHLEHIRRSLGPSALAVTPSECESCGFVFRKRERLTRPGRCPICGGTRITEPAFGIPRRGAE